MIGYSVIGQAVISELSQRRISYRSLITDHRSPILLIAFARLRVHHRNGRDMNDVGDIVARLQQVNRGAQPEQDPPDRLRVGRGLVGEMEILPGLPMRW